MPPISSSQAGPVAVDLTAFDELMGGMSELTATARAAARPAAELRALDDATRDFDAVLGEARALSADPRAAHVLSERLAALTRLEALTGTLQNGRATLRGRVWQADCTPGVAVATNK